MSKNNEPIKEYRPFWNRINDDEDFSIRDYSPTDLHDCSNDLSDRGSRKEEIEHEKFYNKNRNFDEQYFQAKYESAWKSSSVQKNKKNNLIWYIIIITIIIINFTPYMLGFLIEYFYAEIEKNDEVYIEQEVYEEISDELFETYKSNISLEILRTEDGNNIVKLYNANTRSFSNLNIGIVFYDEFGEILKIEEIYTNILLSRNEHFFEIPGIPEGCKSFNYYIENSNGNYANISTKNFYVDRKDYDSGSEVTIKNNTKQNLDYAKVVVAYFKEKQLICIKTCYFFDLKSGEEQKEMIYLYDNIEADEIRMTLNDISI